MQPYQQQFIEMAIGQKALCFGEYTLKSGRVSPYFFNAGLLCTGRALAQLGRCYAHAIIDAGVDYDVLFGPAYKGIPLAAAVSTALSQKYSKLIPICFDRKEEKKHGEGGVLIGSVKNKRVLIIDDVLTAGTALKNSIQIIQEAGGTVSAAIIALDRQEQDGGKQISDKLAGELNIPIYSISNLVNLISFLETKGQKEIAEKLKSSFKN